MYFCFVVPFVVVFVFVFAKVVVVVMFSISFQMAAIFCCCCSLHFYYYSTFEEMYSEAVQGSERLRENMREKLDRSFRWIIYEISS